MSETTEAPRRQPAVSVMTTITDSISRTLEVKKLDALAELDLIEAAGVLTTNNRRAVQRSVVVTVESDLQQVRSERGD